MYYIGHTSEDGRVQALDAHLLGTASLAAQYAQPWGAAHAAAVGQLHDIGKMKPAVQMRLQAPDKYPKSDHSTAGAKEALARRNIPGAFAIAGHHSGLMNMGSKASAPADGTLCGRLKKAGEELPDRSFVERLHVDSVDPLPAWLDAKDAYGISFYTRMLFSCLVDADFIDTQTFMLGAPAPRGGADAVDALLDRLTAHVRKWFPPKRDIDAKRCQVLARCLQGGDDARGLYTLTVPTGGGKTVSSAAFALAHAKRHGLRRVIYVVPYTSIIEQNAAVFREILGDENVLEHHCGVDYEDTGDECADQRQRRRQLATENWDAPVVVTTAVQFFESLYASRTSRCRKLHNVAQSVVIFDEAQMIPLPYLRPCVAAIAELVQHYGVTAVLCTATQPALSDLFAQCAPSLRMTEICPDVPGMAAFFRRVRFVHEGKVDNEALSRRLAQEERVLCVVSSRARARAVFDGLPTEGRYHLSTLMTPRDRRRVIERIRQRLQEGAVCRVVSTSLIEAGVDVDFPAVWREEAGLDSILQAAGRCNREGKRGAKDSVVHVFSGEGGVPQQFRAQVEAMKAAIDGDVQMDDPETIARYFKILLMFKGETVDRHEIIRLCKALCFKDAANAFKLIDSDTHAVYIRTPENAGLIGALCAGEYSRGLMRRLAHDAVNVYEKDFLTLAGEGKIQTFDGFAVLVDSLSYDADCGLSLARAPGIGLFA